MYVLWVDPIYMRAFRLIKKSLLWLSITSHRVGRGEGEEGIKTEQTMGLRTPFAALLFNVSSALKEIHPVCILGNTEPNTRNNVFVREQ